MPHVIRDDPAFQEGYECNYLTEEEGEDEEEDWTTLVTRLVNHIYAHLMKACCGYDTHTGVPDILPWSVGWLLRDLTRLAETDPIFASVGMAHLCFLLPLFTQHHPRNWPRYAPYDAATLHTRAVKDYREQGKSYDEAQRLALVTAQEHD